MLRVGSYPCGAARPLKSAEHKNWGTVAPAFGSQGGWKLARAGTISSGPMSLAYLLPTPKNRGGRKKTGPEGVPKPLKVINSIHKAISVVSAPPLFSAGTLCTQPSRITLAETFSGEGGPRRGHPSP